MVPELTTWAISFLKFSQLSSQCVTSESVWISIKNHWDLEHRRLYLLALKPLQFPPWRVLQLKLLTLITDINWSCREVFWRNSSKIKATIFHLPVVYLYIFYSSDNLRSIWSSKNALQFSGPTYSWVFKKTGKKKLCRYGVDRLSELLSWGYWIGCPAIEFTSWGDSIDEANPARVWCKWRIVFSFQGVLENHSQVILSWSKKSLNGPLNLST